MKDLFEITNIKNVKLRNRFIRSAVWEGIANEEGHIGENYVKLYSDLSSGGIGLIISGYCTIFSYDKPSSNIAGIYNDSFIDEYKNIVNIIHNNGSKVICQIVLGKEYVNRDDNFSSYDFTDDFKEEYIEDIINSFATAALRVKNAGFDGVQLHCAHGYFLSRTLSPLYNKRTDEYGSEKYKLIKEVYKRVREAVGEEYLVAMKINSIDKEENGSGFEECYSTCIELDKLGIDLIEISGGNFKDTKFKGKESIYKESGSEIAKDVKCKVAIVASNRSLENMTEVINNTNIEYMSMARPFICEPNLINRWESGDKTKSKCITCGKCYVNEDGNKCVLNKSI